uniref:Pseudouridine synthase n=1 Tax=Guillardia theta TaxID=55529 RepID=A0A7S4N2Q7_GUITH
MKGFRRHYHSDRINGSKACDPGDRTQDRKVEAGRRVQLHRSLSKLGLCSRGVAWKLIKERRVLVNGKIMSDPLTWIDMQSDQVTVDNVVSERRKETRVWMMNKPRGLIVARVDERGRPTVYSLFQNQNFVEHASTTMTGDDKDGTSNEPWRFPVGRLDADSEGLLLFTNDGQLSQKLLDPTSGVEKTYIVQLKGVPSDDCLVKLSEGIDLDGKKTLPARFQLVEIFDGGKDGKTKRSRIQVQIHEGRFRQIRRMFQIVGFRVKKLQRVCIGCLTLGELPVGKIRELAKDEIERLMTACKIRDSGGMR